MSGEVSGGRRQVPCPPSERDQKRRPGVKLTGERPIGGRPTLLIDAIRSVGQPPPTTDGQANRAEAEIGTGRVAR